MQHFDAIILGGGSAGYAAARTFREEKDRVAIVDGGTALGGLCILRGCMPSKTVIYSAEVLHHARNAKLFGLDIPEARVDMAALHARKNAMVADFAEYRVEQLTSDRYSLFRSRAKFCGVKELELDDGTKLSADFIVLASGSEVQWPKVPGLTPEIAITSDDVLDLDTLPESVIVLGGGVVACELTQYLSRIGASVTQIQRSPRILKEASPEASAVLAQAFRDEGVELYMETALNSVEKTEDGVKVSFTHQDTPVEVEANLLLNALGRKPGSSDLGLDMVGVELLASGHIKTNEFQETSVSGIYATGDLAGPHEIVHIAVRQGELAGSHALGRAPTPLSYDDLLTVVFTDPQVAHVGLTEDEMKERGIAFTSAEYPFNDHGKSILMEAKYGYVKVWAESSSKQILAAECVGKDGGELIHAMAVAVTLKASISDLLKVHWYHPTLAEIWEYPLEELSKGI